MRIHQIPAGARFQWKGVVYTKVGPMTAAAEGGGSVFVPKHAVLAPVEGEAPAQPAPTQAIAPETVIAALDQYHREALALLPEAERPALEAARARCLARLQAG
jgi:hypothetical protein